MNRILAVTMGDPEGIGPEIIRKALRGSRPRHAVLLIGDIDRYGDRRVEAVDAAREISGKGVYFLHVPVDGSRTDPSFEYVREGVRLALEKNVAGLVTGPIDKRKWLAKGIPFRGHTGYLARASGVERVAMTFWAPEMRVVLFTTHIPLKEVVPKVRRPDVEVFLRFVDRELTRLFGRRFHFYICGLNPHAGEGGFMGGEEDSEIIPALKSLEAEVRLAGLFPADTVFLRAREDRDAVVVAWYHDQGLIPFKQAHLFAGVNLTLGLPFVRTSPDHGTAADIAGRDMADPRSMRAAILLAEDLVSERTS